MPSLPGCAARALAGTTVEKGVFRKSVMNRSCAHKPQIVTFMVVADGFGGMLISTLH
jgi:hypothetical protein